MSEQEWTAQQWIDWLRNRKFPPTVRALKDCAIALESALAEHLATKAAWEKMGRGEQ